MKDLFEYLAKHVFNLIGGLFIGFAIPIGSAIISRASDVALFLPLGILFMATSWYYNFVKE